VEITLTEWGGEGCGGGKVGFQKGELGTRQVKRCDVLEKHSVIHVAQGKKRVTK